MAVFDFDKVDDYVQNENTGVSFFKLQDHGWQAKIRFMYGPGEVFQGYSVHNLAQKGEKNKYVPCLREIGQPLEVCPACMSKLPTMGLYFIPIYVISITKCINGVLQPEEFINQPMIFQRGKTFKGTLESAIRQSKGTPLVSNVFNLVRNGKANDTSTNYVLEHIQTDDVTLAQLPERPEVLGSGLLPNYNYEELTAELAKRNTMAAGVVPRQPMMNQSMQMGTQARGNIAMPGMDMTMQPGMNTTINNAPQIPF